MTRYKATPQGTFPYTPEEEEEADQLLAEWIANEPVRQAEKIRDTRDNLLKSTDWMGYSDVVMTEEWRAYRQALRDITSQSGFPSEVTWPTKPES